MGIVLIIALFGALFVADNQEFLDKVEKDIDAGNTWHLVGPRDANPNVISLPITVEGHKPQIIWKLKKD
jgi:hypothetical protein